jgi:hypothetical protein
MFEEQTLASLIWKAINTLSATDEARLDVLENQK